MRHLYQKYRFVKVITVVLITFLSVAVMLPLIKIAELFGINIRENSGLNFDVSFGHIFFFFLFGFCSITIIWLAQKYIHKKKLSALGFRPKMWRPLVIGFLIGAFLTGLYYLILILDAESVNYINVLDPETPLFTYIGYYIYFFIGFIFWNSLIEELTTRAYPIENLKKVMHPQLIFVIMGIIFTLGHFIANDFSLGYCINLFLTSYCFSLLYFYSGSIWLVIGMHSGVNWIHFSFFGTNWKLGALYSIEIYDVSYWLLEYSFPIIKLIFIGLVIYLNRMGFFQKHFPNLDQDKTIADEKPDLNAKQIER